MGSGKSLYGVRRMTQYLVRGQYVVTNVKLYDEAPEIIARNYVRTARAKRAIVADKVRRYYVYEESLEEAMKYRVPGRGESRALMLWDEAHNDLNNRSYKDRSQALLEWATQLRKLGFEGILLSQSHENTDAQLRRICNYLVRLQNQRESTRLLGMRLKAVPPLFLAWWYMTNVPMGSKVKPVKTERYFLSWHRRLYDTLDLYHGVAQLDEVGSIVHLPEGGRHSVPPKAAAPTRSVKPAAGGLDVPPGVA
jgi:hypothetical protein